MIEPHGGKLINLILEEGQVEPDKIDKLVRLEINKELLKDVKNIARGVYSPLTGFLKKDDFKSVVENMHLVSGTVWPIPIVLDINEQEQNKIKNQKEILLVDKQDNPLAILEDIEIYQYDKDNLAKKVFGTNDREHPGVDHIYEMGDYLIGGKIGLIDNTKEVFPEHNLSPAETREMFASRGWNEVVAFQTRNVPHCGHEFLQLEALKQVDGLFVQPVIGKKKIEDFKDEYIISSYEILIDKYYPKDKAILGVLPLKMRYAGPREAVFHAIIRKNFGCSHFIVGRDHAGVGNYYSPFAAQEIFDQFKPDEIGVNILKFPEVVYDNKRKIHCFVADCPEEDKISFSGTKLREKIKTKEAPPEYIIRPEIYNILTNSKNSLVDTMYNQESTNNHKGFVLWLTGLSQSGKTSTADKIYDKLAERGVRAERLDGDIVRESLTKDLGFSKEDRDENIRRVGFVASLLARNGIGVVASFISPYQSERDGLREKNENFIEVFMNTPLEICEQRDTKGLYAKARKGEIKNFTGISDPYEEPKNPEIELKTAEQSVDELADQVVEYLVKNKLIS